MPYGPDGKAEVLSILAFRAYPVNRGFETGRVEVTENPRFAGTTGSLIGSTCGLPSSNLTGVDSGYLAAFGKTQVL
jgi:hypothetical protein